MSMNRRGMIASLVPSTVLLGASAATPATAGPRLIKPNIGPVLAASRETTGAFQVCPSVLQG